MTELPHRPRVLTGIRSNGSLTIGNYLGAMLPMAQLAKKHSQTHDFFMFVPDLHSFITPIDHQTLYSNTIQNLCFYIAANAININDKHTLIYRQSYIPAHSELAWILDCFSYMGELSRMTQFKDKAGVSDANVATLQNHKHESVNVGLFNYPVLMAADILLYGPEYVPVGDDQRQHLEITRDIGFRINEKFKNIMPDGVFKGIPHNWDKHLAFSGQNQGLRIRSLRNPTKKMSKSDSDPAGAILLLEDPSDAAKKIMSATTDSEAKIAYNWNKQPGITNLLQILAMLQNRPTPQVITEWEGKSEYGALKQQVAKQVADFLTDFQRKLANVNKDQVIKHLEACEAIVNTLANQQLLRVQQAVGLRKL